MVGSADLSMSATDDRSMLRHRPLKTRPKGGAETKGTTGYLQLTL
jgi:hypothetical protein